ncbi:MAG TPA: hypothetical protein PKI92_01835 [Candidatus Woesebacteria bacterium]|nr:hypothetical protein [Candidatus Woesebacteria bacterium]
MNFITAVGTFLTTVHAGYTRHNIDKKIAEKRGVDQIKLDKVFKDKMKETFRNALFLGLGAFFITNQIPCAFELSVATFEALYMLSPYTFDKILIRAGANQGRKTEENTDLVTTES